jgi:galactose-1-phosphate uridylyltransferase
MTNFLCPFCTLPSARIVNENAHAVWIRDGFPVSPGHSLVIPKRHVSSFFETSAAERDALLSLLGHRITPNAGNYDCRIRAAGDARAHCQIIFP